MKKPLLLLAIVAVALCAPLSTQGEGPFPITAEEEVAALNTPTPTPQSIPPIKADVPVARVAANTEAHYPVRLIIPSIKLDIPLQPVGINQKGEMAVPDGTTSNAGWYEHGTVPGETGSAVLAAHIFAAFANLKDLNPGSDIYVITAGGAKLHFRVAEKKLYPLAELSAATLFNRHDAKRLNLITCAGQFIAAQGTYDHRLVVYAILVEDSI